MEYIGSRLDGLPVVAGNRVRASLFGNRWADFLVKSTKPEGPVVIVPESVLKIGRPRKTDGKPAPAAPSLSYEDIGGLKRPLERIREIVELPLKYPELFDRLGIDAPKGMLLLGPPVCGKTLIARAVAHETEANFFSVNGPEIIHKFYGESEAHLRKIFDEATRRAPSIIFFDEIDAMASTRASGGREDFGVGSRVLSQMLTELDGIEELKGVLVLAATNRCDLLDPALLRPGRFDLQVDLPLPDHAARLKIFLVHLRDRPLAPNVTVEWLAEQANGFSGVEIEGVCHRAMMAVIAERIEASPEQPDTKGLKISREHLQKVIQDIASRTASVQHE